MKKGTRTDYNASERAANKAAGGATNGSQRADVRAAQLAGWRDLARRSAVRSRALFFSILLVLLALGLTIALASYTQSDASLSTAAGGPPRNWLGAPGAWVADGLLTLFGPPIALLVPLLLVAARRLWQFFPQPHWRRQVITALVAAIALGLAANMLDPEGLPQLPVAGWGGLIGHGLSRGVGWALGAVAPITGIADFVDYARVALVALFGVLGLWLGWKSLRLNRSLLALPPLPRFGRAHDMDAPNAAYGDDDGADDSAAFFDGPQKRAPDARVIGLPDDDEPAQRPAVTAKGRSRPEITTPVAMPKPKARGPQQPELFGNYVLPSVDLLTPAKNTGTGKIDKEALDNNAQVLQKVLRDFQVLGTIDAVRPGPVVTMYELEPAAGTKASRVSNLAEDIARNMSAISARIAPIPGKTVIGIELPNKVRETVSLHELVTSDSFIASKMTLPLILGKNIFGQPVVADLAPMPHLLVAGTTGSGKSVGLNAMILSLLYRLTPDQCRMILIDPKMLELSVYEHIPHLLSPVVTEPQKAVRALKWAVEQMEDRYRKMSSISVRNLESYNDKVRSVLAKGGSLNRPVLTGYHPETGQPIYEEEELDLAPLPLIVVVVDELADLMMTAGKEVEYLIQRLAQKARAAGIHLIMATQRPSVDVITGVIKANLPTRISFQVTSRIDSRTILGDAGAEQLLGKGDMLFMAGGRGVTRVHGPFVSDDEVRHVADHWRTQGRPDYVMAVTEEPEEGGFALDGAPTGSDSEDDRLYRKACQIVIDSQKASTSWLQRQLRIGYNGAARLIERMEAEGVVSAPNHVGRRDVLIDQTGQRVG